MADVGTLVIKMAADSAQMRTELDRVKKELGMTSRAVSSIGKQLSSVGGMIAGAFTVAAVAAFAARVVEAADALQDMSEKLGMSAANLAVMQLAAQQSGGSVDGINTALQKMNATIGDAVNGQQTAVKAFSALGLNFTEVAKLAPDEAFRTIAERLGEVDNVYQRAALAQDIFGKGAKEISALLADGGAAIDDVGGRLDSLGARLTDLDVAKIAMMKDEAAFAGVAFGNLATKVVSSAAPAMGVLLQSFNNVLASMGGASAAGRGFGIAMTALIKGIESVAQLTYGVFETLRGLIYKVAADALQVAGIFNSSAKATAEAWQATANSAFANANRANDAALKAGRDMFNAASVFDAEATRMEQRAAAAAAAAAARQSSAGAAPVATPATQRTGKGAAVDTRTAAEKRMVGVDGQPGLDLSSVITAQGEIEMARAQHFANMELMQTTHAQRIVEQASWQFSTMGKLAQFFGVEYEAIQTSQYEREMTLKESLYSAGTAIMGAMFASNKKFAIAGAVVSTYAAAAKALNEIPYPASIAAVANIIATGMKQVAAIKQTQPGGGTGGGGGGASAVSAQAGMPQELPGLQQQQPQRIAQVVVQGNLFSARETADWLIEQLSDAVNNRDVVFINGQSRQAASISGAA